MLWFLNGFSQVADGCFFGTLQFILYLCNTTVGMTQKVRNTSLGQRGQSGANRFCGQCGTFKALRDLS